MYVFINVGPKHICCPHDVQCMHQVSAHVPGICSFFVCPNCAPSSREDEGESQSELVCLCRPFEAPSAPVPAGPFPLPLIHAIWPAYRSQMSQFNSCLWSFAHAIPLSRDASLPSFWQPLLVHCYLFESCSIQSPIFDSNISWNWLLSDFNGEFKRVSFKAAVTWRLLFLSKLVTTGQES